MRSSKPDLRSARYCVWGVSEDHCLIEGSASCCEIWSDTNRLGELYDRVVEDDLRIARKLKEAVEKRLEQASDITDHALRSLEAVAEGAQRIARLALGASTENVHSDPYATMTDQELAAELERLGLESPESAVQ